VYWLVQERNKQMIRAFDAHSRSSAPLQLMALLEMGLLTDAEIGDFSGDLQSLVHRPDCLKVMPERANQDQDLRQIRVDAGNG